MGLAQHGYDGAGALNTGRGGFAGAAGADGGVVNAAAAADECVSVAADAQRCGAVRERTDPGYGTTDRASYPRHRFAEGAHMIDAIRASDVLSAVDAIDQARAREYSLLSTLLIRSPDAALLRALAGLQGDETPLGIAHSGLAKAAARTDADRVAREYFELFTGVGRGEILPYASFYLTGFLHGRPLAQLRELLRRLGVERAESLTEPEDHAAIMLEIMAGLASGAIAAPAGAERELFENHLAPWLGRLFRDLEQAKAADFYAAVGALGTLFMAVETEAFTLPA